MLVGFASAQAPTGYYDGTAGLTGAALKTKLSTIINNGARDNGYGGLYGGYVTTDTDKYYENDGSLLDMYSENPSGPDPYNYQHGSKQCGDTGKEGNCYNREHSIPQSFFNEESPMRNDIHFVLPTDGKVNGYRSNYPYGIVTSPTIVSLNGSKVGNNSTPGYTGLVFEPIDEFKGDLARGVLYFATRYEAKLSSATWKSGGMLGSTAFPGLTSWELDVMLLWSAQDPVSQREIDRNNAAYAYQGNRNPFIDNPAWVQQIWGTQVPDNEAPSTPTNLAVVSTASTTANLSWTASTDNVAVSFYRILVNGVFKTNSSSNTATVAGLNQGITYNFNVIAVDAAGNASPQSNTATGTTLIDTEAPTPPTNLQIGSVGTNNVTLSWNASTDNEQVASYDIYVDNVLATNSNTVTANVANLNPATNYNFFVKAKDASGNISGESNIANATTAAIGSLCGDENFDSLPAPTSNYTTYDWTSNGIAFTSVDSRTDQTLNGRAITIRRGSLTATAAPNGIGSLTVTTKLIFTGTAGSLKVFINDVDTGKVVPFSATGATFTVTGLDTTGPVDISLVNDQSGNRVIIDDLSWTCYTTAGTNDVATNKNAISISPNPVKNNELNVFGANLSKIESAQIYDFTGKVVQSIAQPFKSSAKIKLNNLPKGVYILKAGTASTKFVVQ